MVKLMKKKELLRLTKAELVRLILNNEKILSEISKTIYLDRKLISDISRESQKNFDDAQIYKAACSDLTMALTAK